MPEEAKKTAKATDNPAPADVEAADKAPLAAGPTEAGSATRLGGASGEALVAEHGAGKLKKAEQEIAQLKDQLLRLRADFENYRKRALREKGEIYENANEALMLELLPVIDHFQLALKSAKEHLALSGPVVPALTCGERSRTSKVEGSTVEPVKGQADSAFQEGLQLIADQMMSALSKYGLNPFNSEKQPFDPNLHEAINCLPSETEPEGTIIAQSRQGYRFNNKMLRPAQVVVSSGKSASLQSEANSQQPVED